MIVRLMISHMRKIGVLIATISALYLPSVSSAQIERHAAGVFRFDIVEKTPAHPYYGMGSDMGYLVDGVEGPTLYFVRDSIYAMHFDTLAAEDFPNAYTDQAGGFLNQYTDINIGSFYKKHYIYWQADEDTPDTLYYGCFERLYAGGMIVVVDSMPKSSVRERQMVTDDARVSSRMTPNPVRVVGLLSFVPPQSGTVQIQIIDAVGRVVRVWSDDLSGGMEARIPIDRDNLMTGIYFYRVISSNSGNDVITSGSFHIL